MSWNGMKRKSFRSKSSRKPASLGFLGAIFPEELGGSGLGYIEYSIIIEELSRIDPSVGLIVAAHNSLCTNHIFVAGSEEQRRKYIPKLATGEWIGSWSLTESESGSDAAGMRTKAVKDGSCWVLNGSKVFTTNAGYADVCVAMAVTRARRLASRSLRVHPGKRRRPVFSSGRRKTSWACAPALPVR